MSSTPARKIGLDPATLAYYDRAQTANGEVATAPIWFESMTLGPVTFSDVRAAVNEGDLFGSLLGMSYLSRFSRIEITGNQLILTP